MKWFRKVTLGLELVATVIAIRELWIAGAGAGLYNATAPGTPEREVLELVRRGVDSVRQF